MDQTEKICKPKPAGFDLREEGHVPTIERMLREGKSWEQIGEAICWEPRTAKRRFAEIAWHELEVLRRDASTFLGFVMTVRAENTEEWMQLFLERANRFAMLVGEHGKFVRENDSIRWVQSEQSTGP